MIVVVDRTMETSAVVSPTNNNNNNREDGVLLRWECCCVGSVVVAVLYFSATVASVEKYGFVGDRSRGTTRNVSPGRELSMVLTHTQDLPHAHNIHLRTLQSSS